MTQSEHHPGTLPEDADLPQMSWRDRAARVRAGALELADVPARVGLDLMRDLFDTILRTSFDAVVLVDRRTGTYLEVSDSFCSLTGHPRGALLGRTSADLRLVEPDGARLVAAADAVLGHEGRYENTLTRSDGERLIVEFTHTLLRDDYTLVIARDITARSAREAALERLVRTDELTGVLNRRGFHADLDIALALAQAEGSDLHLLVADADNLKQINDQLGHRYGDELLVTTTAMLRAATAPYGVVGRLGGDEFAAFLPVGNRGDAEAAVRLVAALSLRRIGPPGQERIASASIGVASASEVGYDADELITLADERMYGIKSSRH